MMQYLVVTSNKTDDLGVKLNTAAADGWTVDKFNTCMSEKLFVYSVIMTREVPDDTVMTTFVPFMA